MRKFQLLAFWIITIIGCPSTPDSDDATTASACPPVTYNTCPDYAPYWSTTACPAGSRCLEFVNNCTSTDTLSYQIGCNSDGSAGAPQCNCTQGPIMDAGTKAYWQIIDGDFPNCPNNWTPACLTSGLAVLVGPTFDCTIGTRVELTAGNSANIYGRADYYDIDVENGVFGTPLSYAPNLPNDCATDSGLDCRPLRCDSITCPDAYATPTTGGCSDGRSPQAACQDTFGNSWGYTVTMCPAAGIDCAESTPCKQN